MYKQSFLLLSLLGSSILAAPQSSQPCYKSQLAEYEDLPYNPNSSTGQPIPTPWLGLDYTTFQVGEYPNSGYIKPSSGSKFVIAYGGTGNITANNHGTLTAHSFYFACVAGVPQPDCAVHVHGYRGGQIVAKRRLIYPAVASGVAQGSVVMKKHDFNDTKWSGVESIGFSINVEKGGNFNGALMIDSFKYDVTCSS